MITDDSKKIRGNSFMEVKGDLFRHLKMDISKKEIQSKIQENTLDSDQGVSLETKSQQKNSGKKNKNEQKKPHLKNGATLKLENDTDENKVPEPKISFLKKLNLF